MEKHNFTISANSTALVLDKDISLLEAADYIPDMEGGDADATTRWTWNGETFTASYDNGLSATLTPPPPPWMASTTPDTPSGYQVSVGSRIEYAPDMLAAMELSDRIAAEIR